VDRPFRPLSKSSSKEIFSHHTLSIHTYCAVRSSPQPHGVFSSPSCFSIRAQAEHFAISFYFRISPFGPSWGVYDLEHEIRHDAFISTEDRYFYDSLAPTKASLVLGEELADALAIRRA
jgi:hypothetical protein